MATHQTQIRRDSILPEVTTQRKPVQAINGPSSGSELARHRADPTTTRFACRVLMVDDEPSIRETVRAILESVGYEALTAADGLDALGVLSKSLPDIIISDLHMPRMSGFEFLAVVRKRFPQIPIVAISGEYSAGPNPPRILADSFLQKGQYTVEEFLEQIKELLAASPIRAFERKSDDAALFVPRDPAGSLIITCPNCLRAFNLVAIHRDGGIHDTTCPSCGTPVSFEIDHTTERLLKSKSA